MYEFQNLLLELDKLKSIYRGNILSDRSRNENSAEHSWHLAIALIALKEILPGDIKLDHAIRVALVHDICEIGAGDVSVYDDGRAQQTVAEGVYIGEFAARFGSFGEDAAALWLEYEEQRTLESIWVKVVDRFLPFLSSVATEGETWKKKGICKSQVVAVNQIIFEKSPELGKWMMNEIDNAVQNGWLLEG